MIRDEPRLTDRTKNYLLAEGLVTTGDVVAFGIDALKKVPGIGKKTIAELECWLADKPEFQAPTWALSAAQKAARVRVMERIEIDKAKAVLERTGHQVVPPEARAFSEQEALQMLEEITTRMLRKQTTAIEGDQQIGGIYWRLCKLLRFFDAKMNDAEGEQHADFLRVTHGRLQP